MIHLAYVSNSSITPIKSQWINTKCLFLAPAKCSAGQMNLWNYLPLHTTQRPKLLGSFDPDISIHGFYTCYQQGSKGGKITECPSSIPAWK